MKIDFKSNEIIWFSENLVKHAHKPLSTSFNEIEVLPDGRILVIEEYYQFSYGRKSNLYCLNRKLEIDWHLDYPCAEFQDNSGYTGFSVNGEDLYANTFNGVRVKFNIDGQILDRRFTK